MKLIETRRLPDNAFLVMLEIADIDIVVAPLDEFDMMLNRECAKSESIADKLLWLETLARRIEEGAKHEKDTLRRD